MDDQLNENGKIFSVIEAILPATCNKFFLFFPVFFIGNRTDKQCYALFILEL